MKIEYLRNGMLKLMSALVVMLVLAACGTTQISRSVDNAGVAGEVIFPDPDRIVLKGGTFPNPSDLRLIGPGVTKDQLYELVGRPHFHEGYAGVREWDYLFNFWEDGRVVTCQYKVIFDKDYRGGSFHWSPESCARFLQGQVSMSTPASEERFTLSADALFAFDRYAESDILPEGRAALDSLAAKLSGTEISHVTVVGHTDRLGSDDYNQLLSGRRANTVRNHLTAHGVPRTKISAEGRGENEPLKACAEESRREELIACLQQNRRVEILVEGAKD